MKIPNFSSLVHSLTVITFPFIHIIIDPGLQMDVAEIAVPKLNDASESTNLSGLVAPVNAITKSKGLSPLIRI
jgi:hypothetical protein